MQPCDMAYAHPCNQGSELVDEMMRHFSISRAPGKQPQWSFESRRESHPKYRFVLDAARHHDRERWDPFLQILRGLIGRVRGCFQQQPAVELP